MAGKGADRPLAQKDAPTFPQISGFQSGLSLSEPQPSSPWAGIDGSAQSTGLLGVGWLRSFLSLEPGKDSMCPLPPPPPCCSRGPR